MQIIYALILLSVFFLIELLYFKIADRYNIIDKPNNRSSHTSITIRGGGIIFFVAVISFFLIGGFQFPYFTLGFFLISLVSFLDDILTLKNKVRILIHFVSVLLLLFQLGLFEMPIWMLIATIVIVIGTINAYNFMDGINGITGFYSFVTIATLFFINQQMVLGINVDLFMYIGLSLLVFNFFNFRTKAKCFAGDVGSISIAFIVIFLIGQLIIQTQDFIYILLLLLYGLDAVTTIGFRLIRKENIFEAHRSHFYQYLVNEKKIPHLYVAGGYGVIQLLINVSVIKVAPISLWYAVLIVLVTLCLFIGIRFTTEGKERLLKKTTV